MKTIIHSIAFAMLSLLPAAPFAHAADLDRTAVSSRRRRTSAG